MPKGEIAPVCAGHSQWLPLTPTGVHDTRRTAAGAPKPGKPGPGRPLGSRNRRPAARHDVGKNLKKATVSKAVGNQTNYPASSGYSSM